MASFCSNCNTEFTSPDQEFCGNCGTARDADQAPPVPTLQRPPTVLLRVQPHKSLPKTVKLTETELEAVTTPAEAAITLTTPAEPAPDTSSTPVDETVETSDRAAEIKPFWQCPQCSHLNSYDAEYCDECGAMYVSPEEQAAKASAKQNEPQSLPPEVLAMLTTHLEAWRKGGLVFQNWQQHQ